MKKILLFILTLITATASAQIPINTPFSVSTPNPIDTRMTIATLGDTATITSLYEGLLVHVNDADTYYKYNGATWEEFQTGGGLSDGDKGDITVAGSGSSLTLNTGSVGSDELVAADVESEYNIQVAAASQAEMEAGTESAVRRMSPLRVAQAISALAAGLSEEANAAGGENLFKVDGTTTGNEIADYLSGVRIPVAQNYKRTDTVSVPAGFTFTPTFDIWRNGDGTFGCDLDDEKYWKDNYFPGGTAFFVDPITGSDSNDGLTPATALATVAAAIAKPGIDVLYLKGAVYPGVASYSTGNLDLSIIGYGGTPIIGMIEAQKTWTATSITGVWKTTVADTISWPLDMTRRGEMGEFVRMTNLSDTASLANNPGSYCYQADSLYVFPSDYQEPDTYTNVLIVDNLTHSPATSTDVYIENVESYGRWTFTVTNANYYIRNSKFFYSPLNDLLTFDSCNVVLSNVVWGHSTADGIDYDNGATAVEHNCFARYAGYDIAGAENQISTAHGAAQVITINSDYAKASNKVIFDVNANTQRWILGGRFGGDWNPEDANTAALGVGNDSADAAEMWTEGAKVGGNTNYDFLGNFGTIYVRDVPINATTRTSLTNGATIQKY